MTCPLGVLGHALSEKDMKECLKPDQVSLYEMARLKKELLKDPCYKLCPMNHCNYIGWVDSSHKCVEHLRCEKCKGTWVDPSLYPTFSRIIRNGKAL